jgi:hypothetical protein
MYIIYMKKLSLLLAFLASFSFAKLICENGKLAFKKGNKVYPASYEFSNDSSRVEIRFIGKNENRKSNSNQMEMPSDLNENEVKEYNEIFKNCPDVKAIKEKQERRQKHKK